MTAETNAMRLVPEMKAAGFSVGLFSTFGHPAGTWGFKSPFGESDKGVPSEADAWKAASETFERERKIAAGYFAAAPAVQPAAGEPVARKHSDKCWGRTSFSDEMAHCYCPRPIGWTNQVALDAARDHPKEAAWMWGAPNGSINIPLYAHPPAQGSESGGEVERLRVLLDNLVIAQTLSREIRQSATDEARSYLYQLRQAALSQPGPASEGDGE